MPQTDYSTTRPVAIEGALVDIANNTIESRVSTDPADIPFGKPVKAETVASGVDKACLLAVASTDTVMGLAVHSNAYAKEEFGTTGLKAGSMVSVLRQGRIWVKAGVTVADGQRAFYQTSTKKWVIAAVALDTIDMTGQCVFRSSGVLDQLVQLEVDMVNKP